MGSGYITSHRINDVLMLIQNHIHNIIDAADRTCLLDILTDGIARQLSRTRRFLYHHTVIGLNGRRSGNTRHNRFSTAGISGKIVKLNISGAYPKIRLRYRTGDIHRCPGVGYAHTHTIVRVRIHTMHHFKDRISRQMAHLRLGMLAVGAKGEYHSNVLRVTASSKQFL